jgi:hypothetical protein
VPRRPDRLKALRVRWKAAAPAVALLAATIASPEFLALVPDRWSHILVGICSLVTIFTPAVVTNRPHSGE